MYIYVYIYIYNIHVYIYICIYVHIYISRERGRESLMHRHTLTHAAGGATVADAQGRGRRGGLAGDERQPRHGKYGATRRATGRKSRMPHSTLNSEHYSGTSLVRNAPPP